MDKGKHLIFLKHGMLSINDIIVELKNGVMRLEVAGGCSNVISDTPVVVNGDVFGDVKSRKSVSCRDVAGNVECGSITCNDVLADVSARNYVQCNDVKGKVYAGGSVIMKRNNTQPAGK